MKHGRGIIHRGIALVLCMALLLGLAACGHVPAEQEKDAPHDTNTEVQKLRPVRKNRAELEQIAAVLGGHEDSEIGQMTDAELEDAAEDLLEELENDPVVPEADTPNQPDEKKPEVDFQEDAYDADGAMKEPFDQIYPELIEQEQVSYDHHSVLVKLSGHPEKPGKALRRAGVEAMEEIVSLKKVSWYEAQLQHGVDAKEAVAALRQLKEVLTAEYNYEVETAAIDRYQEIPEDLKDNSMVMAQWYLNHCGIPAGMTEGKKPGGDPSVVVAVIDTGVDYTHEDLSDNIWVNRGETPADGIDNDGNGYIDDYYGADVITGKGNGGDDNGHGTHVAGIIAAQNNRLGTVGIAYNTRIMPVKAAMASGVLNQSDIAKAIMYAYENGAEVINMSFGGGACSLAVQDALATAYTRCVLVASAGNEGKPNEKNDMNIPPLPNYPAALRYVLGVMSVDQNGRESGFTNWDVTPYNGVEYEVYAPGENIISTIPGNRYASWNGTSMAAPVVSAMAAVLRSEYADRNTYPTKFIYGQLAATSDEYGDCLDGNKHGEHNLPQIVNLRNAIKRLPVPEVHLQGWSAFDTKGFTQDTAGKNNGDNVIDAGETLAVGLTLQNRWGKAKNVRVTVDALSKGGVADPYIEILTPEVNYGEVGTYSNKDCGGVYEDRVLVGWKAPFYIHVKEDCPNDYVAQINVHISSTNGLDESDGRTYKTKGDFTMKVRSGVILPGFIQQDMTLTPDNLYIIPDMTVIREGVTVTVEPGTHIQFWGNDASDPYADQSIAALRVDGNFFVNGTSDKPVKIYPSDLMSDYIVNINEGATGNIQLRYAEVTNFTDLEAYHYTDGNISYAYRCTFRQNYDSRLLWKSESGELNDTYGKLPVLKAEDCVFDRVGTSSTYTRNDRAIIYARELNRCIFVDCAVETNGIQKNCVFLGNCVTGIKDPGEWQTTSAKVAAKDAVEYIPPRLYYRAETGTTYAAMQTAGDALETIKSLGGHAVAVEDGEEWLWLRNHVLREEKQCSVRLEYDGQRQVYRWNNGGEIPAFLQQKGVTDGPWRESTVLTVEGLADATAAWELFEIPGEIYLTDLEPQVQEIRMDLGSQPCQLRVNSLPVLLDAAQLHYESRDPAVAEVNAAGEVTAKSAGRTEILVSSKDKAISVPVAVIVGNLCALEGVELPAGQAVAVGERLAMECVLTPAETTRQAVRFTSSDPTVARVNSDGTIQGLRSGTVTIMAHSAEKVGGQPLTARTELKVYEKGHGVTLEQKAISVGLAQGTAALPMVQLSQGAEANLEWSVSDPAVAEVRDGVVQLKSVGTAALTVKDTWSGQEDSCLLVVQEKEPSAIKDISTGLGAQNNRYVLLEDGRLYYWNASNKKTPVCLATDIKAFDAEFYSILAVCRDNTIKLWREDQIDSAEAWRIQGADIVGTAMADSRRAYYAITSDGRVYAWGKGEQLGLGVNELFEQPRLVPLEHVSDVAVCERVTGFLTERGELYMAGDGVMTPKLCAVGITRLCNHAESSCMVCVDKDGLLRHVTYESNTVERDLSGMYDVAITNRSGIGIIDGQVYLFQGSEEMRKVPGIKNAMRVFAIEKDYYIATEDKALYWLDVEGRLTLLLLEQQMEKMQLFGTNLIPEGKLIDRQLEVQMNKMVVRADGMLLADGKEVVAHTDIQGGRLIISRTGGFMPGTQYEVRFPVGTLQGCGGVRNEEEISISFTTTRKQCVRDDTVERFFWSPEKLKTAMDDLMIHPGFHNNAILNRIRTGDVKHWMKVMAPEYDSYTEVPLVGNYWGTDNEKIISYQLTDYEDSYKYGRLMYQPILTEAPEDTFPFVTDVTVLNKDGQAAETVSNEAITVRVRFNRDMDTQNPLQVSFGSTEPYGDYEITEGKYTDARTWEGKYTLTALTGGGEQLFTISNGCAAGEELRLCRDQGRFGFTIDNTAAQALLMQASATDTGVALSWKQDDFDTLMGYNVYRSDSEDGLYQRLNHTVLPPEQKEFFDDTVEPGKIYYYNFTVVKTDLTESEPSGKISVMSKDTMAPDIYHSPVYSAFMGENLMVNASVTDNLQIIYVNLYYRTVGQSQWKLARMTHMNNSYSGMIPAADLSREGLEYYLEAYDGVSYTYKGSADKPYTVEIREAIPRDALGDVNNDGEITAGDAMLVLYAINDKVNLTPEEFKRADLNGDGVLWAAEALRILQYANGTVGSLTMP